MHKCIVCGKELSQEEFDSLGEEFKPYPACEICFDLFWDADVFLEWAKQDPRPSVQWLYDRVKEE